VLKCIVRLLLLAWLMHSHFKVGFSSALSNCVRRICVYRVFFPGRFQRSSVFLRRYDRMSGHSMYVLEIPQLVAAAEKFRMFLEDMVRLRQRYDVWC